jgi:hypothetical protein
MPMGVREKFVTEVYPHSDSLPALHNVFLHELFQQVYYPTDSFSFFQVPAFQKVSNKNRRVIRITFISFLHNILQYLLIIVSF